MGRGEMRTIRSEREEDDDEEFLQFVPLHPPAGEQLDQQRAA
jgi:hypothetical protein